VIFATTDWLPAGKRAAYHEQVAPLLSVAGDTGDCEPLVAYLLQGSNLPGPRGNWALAEGFADAVAAVCDRRAQAAWDLCQWMTTLGPALAQVGDPREFVPFCGAWALGKLAAARPRFVSPALVRLRELAGDPRGRLREAVAVALQALLQRHDAEVLGALRAWITNEDWLAMRAAVAAVADPAVLQEAGTAEAALALHQAVLSWLAAAEDRKSEAFRALRKGLGYTLSIVVAAVPETGFGFLRELLETSDPDLLGIVRDNLKKARLAKRFPQEVAALSGGRGRGQ